MAVSLRVVVKKNRFPEIADKLPHLVAIGVDSGCEIVEQEAGADAPLKTGALRASRYRVTKLHNGYGAAVAAMKRHNPKASASGVPMLGRKTVGIIGFAADYAIYVHDGTSRMAGRSFLQQAFERNRHRFVEEVRDAIQNGLR